LQQLIACVINSVRGLVVAINIEDQQLSSSEAELVVDGLKREMARKTKIAGFKPDNVHYILLSEGPTL
jgi:hypothetical protein